MADLVFVLDSSGSLGKDNWEKVLKFVKGIVNHLDIGRLGTHVGVVSYGSSATLGFHLDKYTDKDDVTEAVMGTFTDRPRLYLFRSAYFMTTFYFRLVRESHMLIC